MACGKLHKCRLEPGMRIDLVQLARFNEGRDAYPDYGALVVALQMTIVTPGSVCTMVVSYSHRIRTTDITLFLCGHDEC